ncbi:hypothetical protein L3V82_11110 [Thiotrichales bacterium 19S3-7]|nr:hypothetical protein [Thiotrichales bacterium 19S3-7]MCF6802751.1 hypothetical protein [Thiotrichales bacterium 19S3-11]
MSIETILWNPNWDEFQKLSLDAKIAEFEKFVLENSKDNLNNIQLIVAPDDVFSPPS